MMIDWDRVTTILGWILFSSVVLLIADYFIIFVNITVGLWIVIYVAISGLSCGFAIVIIRIERPFP